MTISVRLDPKTQAVLDRLARERRLSRSQVIRESLARLGDEVAGWTAHEAATPYERVKHVIGSLSGPHDLATRSKERVREAIAAKHRARRPR